MRLLYPAIEALQRFAAATGLPHAVLFHNDAQCTEVPCASVQIVHSIPVLRDVITLHDCVVLVLASPNEDPFWQQVFAVLHTNPNTQSLWVHEDEPHNRFLGMPEHLALQTPDPLPLDVQEFIRRPLQSPLLRLGRIVAADVMQYGNDLSSVPLQLALVALRLTKYNPAVFGHYLPVIRKKMRLLTTQRQFNNLLTELKRVLLWSPSESDVRAFFDHVAPLSCSSNAMLFANAPSEDARTLSLLSRLSQSQVWTTQQTFYKQQGMRAWSSNIVPYGVSSSMFIAQAYARVVLRFFADCYHKNLLPTTQVNCYVLEGGSGACKFGLAFARLLLALLEQANLNDVIRPCIILTDLSDQVIESRRAHPAFKALLATHPHAVDFAVMDSQDMILGRSLHLRIADAPLDPQGRPLFFVGNYFLDSLPTDAFLIDSTGVSEIATDDRADAFYPRPLPSLALAHYYHDPLLDATFHALVESILSRHPDRKCLLLFPVHAFRFLEALRRLVGPAAPFGLLVGDAAVHFSDIQHDIPELSPHADCFCLPVDFSVLEQFLATLLPSGQVSSTLQVFSDTFHVLHASSREDSSLSHHCFHEELNGFGANDCDLLLGALEDSAGLTTLPPQVAFLTLSNYDFDCFLVFKWQLIATMRAQPTLNRQPHALVQLGLRCFRNAYSLDATPDFNLQLSMARWFYALEAYEPAAAILKELAPTSQDVRVLYLLGLVCMQLGAMSKAALLFFTCMRKEYRAKYKTRWRLCNDGDVGDGVECQRRP
ncbi:Aste57867_2760 [Aphanomyces stellatus]|uniref:Aste57867_2760 protein n=1 Tax=Aphanomyces stellatus TaxID=120398 RepID=A0A485K9B9_9STRA|nr:hypothetical protein As57867_002753 [Aphanomyces stellatus]VFT79951.1 Aste57867_2760 [Aphanomyces stellatus]